MGSPSIGPKYYEHIIVEDDQGTQEQSLLFFIVMDHIEGETMTHWLYRLFKDSYEEVPDRSVIIKSVLKTTAQLYLAMVNNLVVQNDLKPSNIMFDMNGRVYLIDYGQSQFIHYLDELLPNFIAIKRIFFTDVKQCELSSFIEEILDCWPAFDELFRASFVGRR